MCATKIPILKEEYFKVDPSALINRSISTQELGTVMRSLNMNPTEGELAEMISEVSIDKNSIDFSEFLTLISKRPEQKDAEEEIREAFKEFDKEGTGTTTFAELSHVLMSIGDKLTKEEVSQLQREFEIGSDGKITVDNFVKVMLSK